MDHRDGVDDKKRKISTPLGIKLRFPVVQPLA
jgi:hypothetical protein